MNALLAALSLALCVAIAILVPNYGAAAVLACAAFTCAVAVALYQIGNDKRFLLQIFIAGVLVRMVIGTAIFVLGLQDFFGGDAFTYDEFGYLQLLVWQGETHYESVLSRFATGNWGMNYMVAAVYAVTGRNMLAIQFVNAVIGSATAPAVYLCARHIFQNGSVARFSAFFVAFYPSLVLWSSQGLKDAPVVFLLVMTMLATLKLSEKLSVNYFVVLVCALLCILSMRFYVFYMLVVAIGGTFIIGTRKITQENFFRQFAIIAAAGLVMTYVGVLRTASMQIGEFANLETAQQSRFDQAMTGKSGFAQDVDVSTTSGALSVLPIGMIYLLFAPFPWELMTLRQSITLPEMIVWWAVFPLLILGLWFTVRYRLRQALPILIFTALLTLGYAMFQGNVGTAYRQRAQLLVFYFMFVAVGFVLLRERRADAKRQAEILKQAAQEAIKQAARARRSSERV